MDFEDWAGLFFSILVIGGLIFLLVMVLVDGYNDAGARAMCLLDGYDGGYRAGITGETICWNNVQEQIIEYFKLK